jgi:predicted aspartyl protease
MGDVRVKIKLTNAADDALARHGTLPTDRVRAYEAIALVDTGAVALILPPHVADALGLSTTGKKVVESADGRKDVVAASEPVRIDVLQRFTFAEPLILGDEVLIGQTVLEMTDLHVDCLNRKLVPNPAHPDQPVLTVKQGEGPAGC